METVKEMLLTEQLFNNLTHGLDIAKELGDNRIAAILATMAVLLYNNQQDLINELFEYFKNDLCPRVEQPKQKEEICQTTQ